MSPEQVADSLTEAQRQALVAGCCKRTGNRDCVCLSAERANLVDLGLVRVVTTAGSPAWLISDLGLSVKRILEDRTCQN